jgi:arabinose-5-phosphate isomerase
MSKIDFKSIASKVLKLEADAVLNLQDNLNNDFVKACELILDNQGRLIVVGIGKSGHIGNKIAATFASTGTPSFFVHPSEASHGDLGMITQKDIVLAISNSGETPEILTILPIIKRMGIKLISLCGKVESSIVKHSDAFLNTSVEKEACPLNLAPTTSTTATLAMGDALAMAVLESREFDANDFARSHPGGALGRRLLIYVEDIMHKGDNIPLAKESATFDQVLDEMSQRVLGMSGIINDSNKLVGIFTDGDLRRVLTNNTSIDIKTTKIAELMTSDPYTAKPDMLAAELLAIMQKKTINGVIVVDNENNIVGALNMQDLLRAGVM